MHRRCTERFRDLSSKAIHAASSRPGRPSRWTAASAGRLSMLRLSCSASPLRESRLDSHLRPLEGDLYELRRGELVARRTEGRGPGEWATYARQNARIAGCIAGSG